MTRLTRRATLAVAVALAPLACKDDTPADAAVTDIGKVGFDAPMGDIGGFDAGRDAVDGIDAPDAMLDLADGEIAAVVAAVNAGEIAQGNLADSRAVDPAVRAYAARMVSEHSEAASALDALLTNRGITPAKSTLSRQVAADAMASLEMLRLRTGTAFDGGYVNAQIAMHAQALGMLDTALIPSADDASLREMLTTMRATVQQHLDDARTLAMRDGGTP